MVEAVDLRFIFVSLLVWIFSAFFLIPFFFKKSERSNVRLPPSPPALPIIGHLHLLLSFPLFQPLQRLTSKYGPLLRLQVFGFSIIVVSSASVAYEIYRTQDANFSFRHNEVIEDSIIFSSYGFMTTTHSDYYKFMRKLLVTKLLGPQHLERSRLVRGEELERFYVNLLEKARRKEGIEMHKEIMKLTNNTICRMIIGRKWSEESGEANEIQDLVMKSNGVLRKILIANGLRSFKRLGAKSWFEKEARHISHRYDMFLEKILVEHEKNPNEEQKDITDLLLEAYHDENAEFKLTRNHIKAFLVELFLAGTDTSAVATQWTMAELINHPNILDKLRKEIEGVVGKNRTIQETDLPNLPYLRAVVKEGLRLHPPGALLPRTSKERCKVRGFDVFERTAFLVNTYAIMRDPDSWEDPDEFRPERFLVSSSSTVEEKEDIKEQALKYVPFGGGRRICPGINLAYLSMGMVIGTMVHHFDWEIIGDKVDMEETGLFNLTMAHPLECTPVVRFNRFTSIP
ncbi:PREDICTED: cytochrome P450 705A5-like [Tarenaya hassleriana]|uniref:cytochrome P450 705A5-like n=1 Tax=Tarenaya hassleriana TaxID=28532 RepID=UPI00053C7F88|nr:PREDICTED: cytochrome P450 705A5-like [Tarenaya hassleriana]